METQSLSTNTINANMIPIPLTKQQKKRILQMCNTFFPKYDWQFCSDYGTLNCDTQIDALIQWKPTGKHSQDHINSFHWFEFCVNELADVLYKSTKLKMDLEEFRGLLLLKKGDHPIDFLYKCFKEL